jgi:NADH dehydrogenase [ubiquinone] 1 alpha subcomplex assembly factor 5
MMTRGPLLARFFKLYDPPIGTAARRYAIQSGNPTLKVFNRKTKHLQKERAARNVELSRKVDYLKDEVATRLCERLLV